MTSTPGAQRPAVVLGLVGGRLGVVAGLVQLTVGAQIPSWSGHKSNPVGLCVLTIVLSTVALLAVLVLVRRASVTLGQRIAIIIGVTVPAALCFSTVGALWYIPGALLVSASALLMTGVDPRPTRQLVIDRWPQVLIGGLGACVLLMAVSVVPLLVGVVGGLALAAAPWVPSAVARMVLLLAGSVPFAILTWQSLVTPLLAVLAIAVGIASGIGRTTTLSADATNDPRRLPAGRNHAGEAFSVSS